MKILFITDNFPPEVNAPASRTYEHIKQWQARGADVTVITCVPNFPSGKPFKGYKNKLYQWENYHGINVLRVWTYMTANEGFLKRILDYLSFMIMSVFASFFLRRPDVIIATSPQFFSACAGALIGLIKRRPWVFEVRDLWPESIKVVGAINQSFAIKVLEKIELWLYKNASLIIVVTKGFKNFIENKGIPSSKIEVVTNGVDLNFFKPKAKPNELLNSLQLRDNFVVGYIGTHGMAQDLTVIIRGISVFQQKFPKSNVKFLFLGGGAGKSEVVTLANSLEIENTIFLDFVPKEVVSDYWAILDFAITHLRPDPMFDVVIPSKIFECMAMGIPLLHGVSGESSEIVVANKAGLAFQAGDPNSFAEALEKVFLNSELRAEMKQNALKTANTFSRESLAQKMYSRIESQLRKASK